jgi:hypothetical protein
VKKNSFNKIIEVFSEVYNKTLEKNVLNIYFDMFSEIPDKDVDEIIKYCLQYCRFFPKPVDVFEAYENIDKLEELK